ncbi:MAG: RNA methyltransferase [Bryobacterales bacterium]|nr:RNA methyltransferase [Bryobacterales bacterium]
MNPARTVTSPSNPLLKEARRVLRQGGLTADGLLVVETFHLLDEALRSSGSVRTVVASTARRAEIDARRLPAAAALIWATPRALDAVSATVTAQGVLAFVEPPGWGWDDVMRAPALVVVLDGLRDPGNAGTILRAAEAFGATGAAFGEGSVSPYHAKVVRASAGSLFRLPCLAGIPPSEVRQRLEKSGCAPMVTVPSGGIAPADAALDRPVALVIGNEAQGVSASWDGCKRLSVPTAGVESLNAAVAASIVLYEASRQRARCS